MTTQTNTTSMSGGHNKTPSYMGEKSNNDPNKSKGMTEPKDGRSNIKSQAKNNKKKLSFKGASIEEEFEYAVITQINGFQVSTH